MKKIFMMPGLGVLGGAGWKDVAVPDVAFPTLPFSIQKRGNTIRVSPTFNLETHANITVSKTYYVKTAADGGSDAASGADEDHALATIKTAMAKADVDQVLIKAGTYVWGGDTNAPNRSMKIKAYGGAVIMDNSLAGLSWSAVDNHYEAVLTNTLMGSVVDFSVPDASGDGIPLDYRASVALVDANAGSWFYTAGTIAVRTLDSRAPDANIKVFANYNGYMDDGVTWYIEGLSFHGGGNVRGVFYVISNSANLKLYFKDCNFKYAANNVANDGVIIKGGGEVIFQNCVASRNGNDGFKGVARYDDGTTPTSDAAIYLIDCIGRYNGRLGQTNCNGFSRHGQSAGGTNTTSVSVLINCLLNNNNGPAQADAFSKAYTWMLGCNMHDSLVESCAGINLWLDTCISASAPYDIGAGAGTFTYYRNMTPATPTVTGAGTVATY